MEAITGIIDNLINKTTEVHEDVVFDEYDEEEIEKLEPRMEFAELAKCAYEYFKEHFDGTDAMFGVHYNIPAEHRYFWTNKVFSVEDFIALCTFIANVHDNFHEYSNAVKVFEKVCTDSYPVGSIGFDSENFYEFLNHVISTKPKLDMNDDNFISAIQKFGDVVCWENFYSEFVECLNGKYTMENDNMYDYDTS